jgi:putative membrane protein insertion efficiency factor
MTTVTTPPQGPAADTTMTTSAHPGAPSSGVLTASSRQPWSRRGALLLLRAYQGAASGRVLTCRYYPSCSNYAVEAFSVHGFWRAFGLTGRRLLRCRPFGSHGIDLVPLPDGVTHECDVHAPQVSGMDTHTSDDTHEPSSGTNEVRQPC